MTHTLSLGPHTTLSSWDKLKIEINISDTEAIKCSNVNTFVNHCVHLNSFSYAYLAL